MTDEFPWRKTHAAANAAISTCRPDGCVYRALIERLCDNYDAVSRFNKDIVDTGKSQLDSDEQYADYLELILEAKSLLQSK